MKNDKRCSSMLLNFLIILLPWTTRSQPGLNFPNLPSRKMQDLFRHENWERHDEAVALQDSNVTLLGRWAWGECFAVASKDEFVYVGNGGVLQVFNALDSSSPKILTELLLGGVISDIQISGDKAYVLAGINLVILDLAIPSQPQQLGQLRLFRAPERLCVAANYCYVLGFDTMIIVDVSQPTQPTLLSSIPAGGENSTSIIAIGNYVYIGHRQIVSFMIVDVSDPTNPEWADTYSFIGTPYSLALFGNYLLVGGLNFRILDVSQPTKPNRLVTLSIERRITGIVIRDSCAFLSVTDSGLFVVDISEILAPKIIAFLEKKGVGQFSQTITLSRNHAHLAMYTGYWVVDIRDKTAPKESFYFPTANAALEVAVDGQHLYVADGWAGLWILDISNPSFPKPIANLNTDGLTTQVKVHEGFAYLVNLPVSYRPGAKSGLIIVDVSKPHQPQIISRYQGFVHDTYTGSGNRIAVANSFVFLTQFDIGLEIVDVMNPYAPQLVGSFLRSMVNDVDVTDEYAYLGTLESGMRSINIKDPARPREVGYFQKPNVSAVRIKAVGSTVYLDEGTAIRILDVSNPSQPIEFSYLPVNFGILDLEVKDRYLHIPSLVVDISSSRTPQIVGRYSQSKPATGITTDGQNIFVAAGYSVDIWRNDLVNTVPGEDQNRVPKDYILLQNFPNPFHAKTQISFNLPNDAIVKLEIYNVLGERIHTLVNGVKNQGKHTITFNATGLTNGIYCCRLQVGKEVRQIKMLIVQ